MKWELPALSVFGQGSERPVKPTGQLFIFEKSNLAERRGKDGWPGHGRLLLLSYPTFLSTHLMDYYYT
jgi:hypothetical protein